MEFADAESIAIEIIDLIDKRIREKEFQEENYENKRIFVSRLADILYHKIPD